MPFQYKNPSPVYRGSQDSYVRAIALLEGRTWEEVYMDICREALTLAENPQIEEVALAYLKKHHPKAECFTGGSTVKDFIATHPQGRYLLSLGRDWATCVMDGTLYDARNYINKPIQKFWKLP